MKKILLFLLCFSTGIGYSQATCATAQVIVPGTYNSGVINGVHIGGCFTGTVPANGNWYVFTSTSPGFARLNTNIPSNPPAGDSRISVFTGTCAALTCVAANDDVSQTNYLSDLTWVTTANTTYYIQFDNRWGIDANDLDFQFTYNAADCSTVTAFPYAQTMANWNPNFACFTFNNVVPASRTWSYNDINDVTGDTVPDQIINIFPPTTAEAKDDWLFSLPISLEVGNEYTFTAKYNTFNLAGENPQDNLQMFVTDAASPSASFQQSIFVNNAFAPATTAVGQLFSTAFNSTGTFTPTTSGIYHIALHATSVANRTVLMLFELGISVTLSVNDNTTSNFSIYPNPTNDVLNISMNSGSSLSEIRINDIQGRNVMNVNNPTETISVSNLNSGVYFITVVSDNVEATQKFIKK